MEKINLLIKESFSKKQLIINSIFIIASILIVGQNSAFMFNPFILVLLCVSYAFSFFTFLFSGIVGIITAFIINEIYGIELILLLVIIMIFYFVSLIFNGKRLRIYVPCILSNICVFFIYLFSSKPSFYAINSLVLLLISLSLSIIFLSSIDKHKHKEEVGKIELALVLSFITTLFISISSFSFVWMIIVFIILIKMNKLELTMITSFASFLLFYLFSNTPLTLLITIYLSIFFITIIRSKFNYFFFVPFVSLFMMSINESFYLDQIYYQVIVGYLIGVLFPSQFIDKLRTIIDYSTADSLKDIVDYQNKKFLEISNLCTLLMDDRFDSVDDLDIQLERLIKKDVCKKCSNSNCSLNLKKYLTGYLSNSEKKEIVDNCLYPYQIQKEINNSNKRIVEYSEREQKSVESRKIMNNAYQIIKKYIEIAPTVPKKTKNYNIDVSKLTKEASSSPNGDSCEVYDDNYHTIMALSDGMGHTSKSRDISEYLIELVNYLYLISNKTDDAIESSNQILLAKTYEEVYATLDFCEFDLEKGKASIYKAGSFPTYLIRNKQVKEISTKLPPLGIINNIKIVPDEIELKHNDILLFLTDGFGENVRETIEKYVQKSSFLPINNYVKFLFKKLNENVKTEDDQTLIGIKISKS
ncbi:MAG: hypothetical protein E7177_00525 [Erysipelotrichaceae bacterium]|nr:hypothetical protein [Erysipelotrichaceae bacterium]